MTKASHHIHHLQFPALFMVALQRKRTTRHVSYELSLMAKLCHYFEGRLSFSSAGMNRIRSIFDAKQLSQQFVLENELFKNRFAYQARQSN